MFRRTTALIIGIAAAMLGLTPLTAIEVGFAQQIQITEEQFNQWLTNGRATPQQQFETQLSGRLSRLDATCELTHHQRVKLELAARGDIARFQSELAPVHDELVGQSFDQNRFDAVFQKIAPFQERIRRGILDDGSLFQKVLANTLDGEQRLAYERAESEQIAFQYRAAVKLFVATLDATAPMLDKQREDLLALLLKTTQPPKRWVSRYQWIYVLYQVSKEPPEVQTILDAAQLRCFKNAVKQGARYGPTLKQEGMLPADDTVRPAEPRRGNNAAGNAIPQIQIGLP
jgi:hypothetical protein